MWSCVDLIRGLRRSFYMHCNLCDLEDIRDVFRSVINTMGNVVFATSFFMSPTDAKESRVA